MISPHPKSTLLGWCATTLSVITLGTTVESPGETIFIGGSNEKPFEISVSYCCSFAVLVGMRGRPEDGVIKEETELNNTTGKVDLPHTEGYVTTDNTGMQLWYDIFGDMDNPKVLLIHGNEAQAVSWMPHFYELLVNAGYCVMRFDHRGNGLSENFNKPKGVKPGKWTPDQAPPYTLVDMAGDAIGLLEKLDIEAAHVTGHSMGGMIAQLVAIRRPDMINHFQR